MSSAAAPAEPLHPTEIIESNTRARTLDLRYTVFRSPCRPVSLAPVSRPDLRSSADDTEGQKQGAHDRERLHSSHGFPVVRVVLWRWSLLGTRRSPDLPARCSLEADPSAPAHVREPSP